MKGPLFWILFQRCSAEFLKFLIFWAKWPKPKIAGVPPGNVTMPGHLARFQPRARAGPSAPRPSPGTTMHKPGTSTWGHRNSKCSPFVGLWWRVLTLWASSYNDQPLRPGALSTYSTTRHSVFPAPLKSRVGIFWIIVYNIYFFFLSNHNVSILFPQHLWECCVQIPFELNRFISINL